MKKDKNNITLSSKNIIWFLENLTDYFTDKNKIITFSLIILILSFINITLSSSNNSNSVLSLFSLSSTSVSALSYESNVGIGFSFNPTLSISFSSSDLVISNLAPGTTNDSNDIVVSVSTNAAYGYTLSVGTNSDNLVHSNNSNIFSSIGTDASLSSLTTDNTWGYSYKNNLASTPTWSNYSGLSTDTSKVLFNTDSNTSSSIGFKIGAKASSTQASGEYTNTINFIAISKPIPRTIDDIAYMQTFGELNTTDLESVKSSMVKNTTYTLKDQRDEQEYTIAKLEDGKIWMTKNLNIAGGTALSSKDTDIDDSYIDNFSTSNNLTKTNNAIVLPESSTSGFDINNYAYVYNSSNENCGKNSPCYSYYSWDAVVLGSGRNIGTDNTDAPYSICPKGWKLPNTYNGTNSSTDLRSLIIAYGGFDTIQIYDNNTSPTGATIYNNIGPGTTPNFLRSGYYGNSSFSSGGAYGCYWSSTSAGNSNSARYLYFYSSRMDPANNGGRRVGFAVRCLAK